MSTKDYNYTSNAVSLSPEMVSFLNLKITKMAKKLLLTLYQHPQQSQAELIQELETSPSSFSNLLNRDFFTAMPLLNIQKSGRKKYYSLTPIADQYVAQFLTSNEKSKIRSFSSASRNEDPVLYAQLLLDDFRNTAGEDWNIFLDDLLLNIPLSEKDFDTVSKLTRIFNDFIKIVLDLRMKNATLSLANIYDSLEQSIIVKRLEQYINNSLEFFFNLEPLFLLAEKNVQAAFEVIDNVFCELYPSIYKRSFLPALSQYNFITNEQYNNIFRTTNQLINDAIENNLDKTGILDHWIHLFHCQNPILFYLAEKYIMVNTLKQKENRW